MVALPSSDGEEMAFNPSSMSPSNCLDAMLAEDDAKVVVLRWHKVTILRPESLCCRMRIERKRSNFERSTFPRRSCRRLWLLSSGPETASLGSSTSS